MSRQPHKQHANGIQINKADFIKENKGEFKDYYKLGPIIGSGMIVSQDPTGRSENASTNPLRNYEQLKLYSRRGWRGTSKPRSAMKCPSSGGSYSFT
jgi:hypothetical protein